MQQPNIQMRKELQHSSNQRKQELKERYLKLIEQGYRVFSDYDEETDPYNDDCDYCNEANCC